MKKKFAFSWAVLAFFASPIVFAGFSITGQVDSGRMTLTWDSQVNHEYTIALSTNLVEGYNTSATVQSTPPLNTWWENIGHDARFYVVSRPLITNSPATPPGTTNLIVNGTFTNGLTDWVSAVNSNNGAEAVLSVTNGEFYADIVSGGTQQYYILLRQFDIPLENGTNYVIEFDARASAVRNIRVIAQDASGSPSFESEWISLSTNMDHYSIPFTMTGASSPTNRIHFGLGADDSSVWLDNIELSYITSAGSVAGIRNVAHEINRRLGRGNNFMAAKSMNAQGAPEDYELLNSHHFAHCRIGYKMDEVAGSGPDYLIPANEMANLQNMVDWCLDEGLIAVIDPVHNWANNTGDAQYDPDDLDKLSTIWVQVAALFADYDLKNVVFEVMNEPHSEDDVAEIITTCLAAIRSQAGNEERIVIVSGDGFSTRQALIDAFDNDEIPADDNHLIGTFHYYDPKTFTKQGASNITWGTTGEIAQVGIDFDEVETANTHWATRNDTEPLPLYLGEFGVDNGAPASDRKQWLAWIRMEAEARGFSWAHWNMYQNSASSKGMGPWTSAEQNNPDQRYFDADPAEALVGRYEFEDGTSGGGVTSESDYAGFTGTGYAAFPTNTGVAVWARAEDLYIPADTNYLVQIHYASDTARELRLVSRNDTTTVQTINNVLFPATGGLNSWQTLEIEVAFTAGELGNLKVVATPDPGVNLDWLRITLPAVNTE
jgi:endoglucanase